MAHAQKPDFVFRRNGRVHLNRRGRHFSRLLVAEVCASAVVMLDTPCSEVAWRVLATHSIRQFPLHLPSRTPPYAITFQLESNGKSHPVEYVYTRLLTSALDVVICSTPRPGRFTPRKETRCPLHSRLGGPQSRSGRVRKISPPLGFDPRTVKPVASRCTDWAIPAL